MKYLKNQKGQAIVAIFFVMILALIIGVGVSSRFIKSLRGSVRTDASYRALAIAEALVEKLLIVPSETLEEYIQFSSCGDECVLEIVGDDRVVATATAALSHLGESSDPLLMELKTDEAREVSLNGYSDNTEVSICWDSLLAGDLPSVVGVFVHGTDGDYSSESFAYNSIGSLHGDNGFSDAVAGFGYSHCFTLTGEQDPVLLRLRSVYNDTDAYVVPAGSATIPSQGILIESTGAVEDVSRKVTVLKSSPFLPLPFDYVLFQKSTTEPLSN